MDRTGIHAGRGATRNRYRCSSRRRSSVRRRVDGCAIRKFSNWAADAAPTRKRDHATRKVVGCAVLALERKRHGSRVSDGPLNRRGLRDARKRPIYRDGPVRDNAEQCDVHMPILEPADMTPGKCRSPRNRRVDRGLLRLTGMSAAATATTALAFSRLCFLGHDVSLM